MSLDRKEILEKIEALNEALWSESLALAEKYGFVVERKKIRFLEDTKKQHKQYRTPSWQYVIPQRVGHVLSLPFIYMMIVPTVILDVCITLYNHIALPLCGIPRVERSRYMVYDRRFLQYLNMVQKLHCLYCSYVNGVFGYAVEIAARTERYWCPVKAAGKPGYQHRWYEEFADYGNPKEWKEKFNTIEK